MSKPKTGIFYVPIAAHAHPATRAHRPPCPSAPVPAHPPVPVRAHAHPLPMPVRCPCPSAARARECPCPSAAVPVSCPRPSLIRTRHLPLPAIGQFCKGKLSALSLLAD